MARFFAVALALSVLAIPGSSQTKSGDSQLTQPGVNGVTKPACVYCPVPDYTDQARKDKVQGAVVVQALVTVEGRAENISVVRGLGSGLDEKAVEIVRKWRFKPAHTSDGHPVAVSVPMEVTFHLD
jgi:protein TonB